MANDYMTGLNSAMRTATPALTKTSAEERTAAGTGGRGDLGISDFIKLLVAQLQNQDMMNPMTDTDFIAQMAQFSALQAMDSVAESNLTSYAASLVGKEVTAAALDKKGNIEKTTGTVTGVSLFEGRPIIYIGDKAFELSQVMAVGKLPEPEKPPEVEDPEKPPVTEDPEKPPVVEEKPITE